MKSCILCLVLTAVMHANFILKFFPNWRNRNQTNNPNKFPGLTVLKVIEEVKVSQLVTLSNKIMWLKILSTDWRWRETDRWFPGHLMKVAKLQNILNQLEIYIWSCSKVTGLMSRSIPNSDSHVSFTALIRDLTPLAVAMVMCHTASFWDSSLKKQILTVDPVSLHTSCKGKNTEINEMIYTQRHVGISRNFSFQQN